MSNMILVLGAVLLTAAFVLSWSYERFRTRGVAIGTLVVIALALTALLPWRETGTGAETPLGLELTIVVVTLLGVALAVVKAGASGKGLGLRALWGLLIGAIAFITTSFLAYAGWVWLG